jgi:hypothetical protein
MEENKSFVFIISEIFLEFIVFLDLYTIKALTFTCRKLYDLCYIEYKKRGLATKLTQSYIRDVTLYPYWCETTGLNMTPKDHIELSNISKDIEHMTHIGYFYINPKNIINFYKYRKTVSHPVHHNLRYYEGESKENTKKFITRVPLVVFAVVAKYLTPLEVRIVYLHLYHWYCRCVYEASYDDFLKISYYEFMKISFAFHSDVRKLIGSSKKFRKFIKKYSRIKNFVGGALNHNVRDMEPINNADINVDIEKIYHRYAREKSATNWIIYYPK